MAMHGKIVTTLELKSSAEKFYKVWRSESFHVPKHASKHIQGVDVHAGDIMKLYKVYKPIWKFTPKGSGCFAKLTLEYEKLHPDVPVPEIYVDLIVHMTKDIDEALSME
ncbi:LATEX PROTEIN putative-RELATED [Salix purpurea]|uniref:LATEX PROTEIN putative-RELATED n=1 Tax=Salix purpurea TaxID=77065 RepID=A0A9Q0UA30_SALPP|nr:LATEX PROTEIN putative-RELATED [Salix purpurea]